MLWVLIFMILFFAITLLIIFWFYIHLKIIKKEAQSSNRLASWEWENQIAPSLNRYETMSINDNNLTKQYDSICRIYQEIIEINKNIKITSKKILDWFENPDRLNILFKYTKELKDFQKQFEHEDKKLKEESFVFDNNQMQFENQLEKSRKNIQCIEKYFKENENAFFSTKQTIKATIKNVQEILEQVEHDGVERITEQYKKLDSISSSNNLMSKNLKKISFLDYIASFRIKYVIDELEKIILDSKKKGIDFINIENNLEEVKELGDSFEKEIKILTSDTKKTFVMRIYEIYLSIINLYNRNIANFNWIQSNIEPLKEANEAIYKYSQFILSAFKDSETMKNFENHTIENWQSQIIYQQDKIDDFFDRLKLNQNPLDINLLLKFFFDFSQLINMMIDLYEFNNKIIEDINYTNFKFSQDIQNYKNHFSFLEWLISIASKNKMSFTYEEQKILEQILSINVLINKENDENISIENKKKLSWNILKFEKLLNSFYIKVWEKIEYIHLYEIIVQQNQIRRLNDQEINLAFQQADKEFKKNQYQNAVHLLIDSLTKEVN
ncbi:predicted coding region [Mycoplasmopsis pulmonis]|uniref:Septation ring formation regulator n=2 Tax=Mycoplasmopsis pulmonis TaxID=2107 RepID=Q98PK5_MYCPU|nr:predicted coding region [Mycoplasmopsis pulmonis]